MKIFKIATTIMLLLSCSFAGIKEIDQISQKMGILKQEFEKTNSELESLKKEVSDLKAKYNIAPKNSDKNTIAEILNKKQKEMFDIYSKCKELKESFNKTSYELAKEKHDTLSRALAEEEIVVAQKEQSCKDMGLEECQKKAYNMAKKEAEKLSFETIITRIKESGIEVENKKIEKGVQTNIQSYSNLDNGYYYALKTDVNAELILDEHELFDVEKITWNDLFDEPEEIPQLPLDNLDIPGAEGASQQEKEAPSVYHSGVFASLVLSSQSHKLSSLEERDASAFAFQLGYKSKTKDRAYYEYERVYDSGDALITNHGAHIDWSINLQRAIYPYFGVGYSIAKLKTTDYEYDGSGYHLRLGAGYEIRDDMEIDFAFRRSMIVWTVANGDVGIADLGMSRDLTSYSITVSYLF